MDDKERKARIELTFKYQLSSLKVVKIIETIGSAQVFCALNSYQQEKIIPGIVLDNDFKLDDINGFKYFVLGDKNYPYLLSQITDPPIVLFYKGNISNLDLSKALSIVGTRRPTNYGRLITEQLTTEVVQAGLITVSGLAFGIDALVHKTTLSNNGRTIAVLGTAIDTPYPPSHRYLYDQICENNGVIFSESYLDVPYCKWVFPKRNRIIAGLSRLSMVMEAARRSGALLTANYAFQYDRDVFALPGPINSQQSQGTNWLIKNDKAKLYNGTGDVFELFGIQATELQIERIKTLSIEQQVVLDLISKGNIQFDQLLSSSKFEINKLNRILGVLEITKFITRSGSGTINLQIE